METTSQARAPAEGVGGKIWLAGVAAGALGGLAMMACMVAAAALEGGDPLAPVRAVGTVFRGSDATLDGISPVAWGVLVDLAIGAFLAVVFAAAVPRDMPLSSAMVLGAGCGLIWMALAVAVIIPRVAPMLADHMPRQGGAWVIAYGVYGAVAGLAPWLRRRLGERVHRPEASRAGPLRPRTSP